MITQIERIDKTIDNMIKVSKRGLKRADGTTKIEINSRLSTLYEIKRVIADSEVNNEYKRLQ